MPQWGVSTSRSFAIYTRLMSPGFSIRYVNGPERDLEFHGRLHLYLIVGVI
jgi:hypothetical protein